jgi:hypothetical protein
MLRAASPALKRASASRKAEPDDGPLRPGNAFAEAITGGSVAEHTRRRLREDADTCESPEQTKQAGRIGFRLRGQSVYGERPIHKEVGQLKFGRDRHGPALPIA